MQVKKKSRKELEYIQMNVVMLFAFRFIKIVHRACEMHAHRNRPAVFFKV